MRRARSGQGLFAVFVENYASLVHQLQHVLGSRADAQDVLQDTWFKLDRANLPVEIANPRAFLWRAVRNIAVDHLRARSGRARLVQAAELMCDSAPSSERLLEQRQRLQRLQDIVSNLPERQRQAFILHKFDGLSHSEVAERLGISRSAVEKLVIRALAHCRDGMGELLDDR